MAPPTSPAVVTALTILEQLSASPEMGVSELARKLHIGKSSAHRLLNTLAQKVEESVNLGILEQDRILNLLKVEGPHPIRLHIDAPGGVYVDATALGKALLAALSPEDLRRRIAGKKLTRLTPNTLATLSALEREFERVRHQGYTVDNEECSAGIRAIAAVIRDRQQSAVAAISIAGPTFRMTDKRIAVFAPLVTEAGREISRCLGWEQLSAV